MNDKKFNRFFMLGNEACGAGAIAAGVRFFAGYPITPSSEIAEYMARELPKVDGIYIQMEDEIASMGALIGASVAGAKVMTATSGAGFSLMQEFISYAGITEIPCVIVDVMRGGPGGGSATQPAQADVMQARWGPHGDHPIIVLSASTVPEMFFLMIKAVNFSEKYRVPVILLSDESIGHLREVIEIPDTQLLETVDRKKPNVPPESFEPLRVEEDQIPPMGIFGEGYRVKGYCRLVRNSKGDPVSDPAIQDHLIRRLQNKIDYHLSEIQISDEKDTEDADVLIFAHGSVVRAAYRASNLARELGIRSGVFKATTIWPFPRAQIERLSVKVKAIIVPELNLGQIIGEVERACWKRIPIIGIHRVDGSLITAQDILKKVKELS
ncbi:2-oxoacid:acceptor oxidoreductase subunit alpha [Thermodesulfobacteriota bacterium]